MKLWKVMRNLIACLGLVVMGVLIAGLITEATLRVTDAVPEVESPLSGCHQSDAYLGWSGKPNLRLRFRRPEFDALVEHSYSRDLCLISRRNTLRRRTIQSYAEFSRFSELSESGLIVVKSGYFRSAICVLSITQIL